LPAPYPIYAGGNLTVVQDGNDIQRFGCFNDGSIQFIVLDSLTLKPWENPGGGKYGAANRCGTNRNWHAFEYRLKTYAGRDSARKFLDIVPDGNYIIIRNSIDNNHNINAALVPNWGDDELINGPGI